MVTEKEFEALENYTAELEQIFYASEAANFSHLLRIEKLEKLCRDMYLQLLNAYHVKELDGFNECMEELNLLELDNE